MMDAISYSNLFATLYIFDIHMIYLYERVGYVFPVPTCWVHFSRHEEIFGSYREKPIPTKLVPGVTCVDAQFLWGDTDFCLKQLYAKE
jgi:hypothetical protein